MHKKIAKGIFGMPLAKKHVAAPDKTIDPDASEKQIKGTFAAKLEHMMQTDYERDYDGLQAAPKDLALPPTGDDSKPTVQIWKYVVQYAKANFQERFELAKIKRIAIEHNSPLYEKRQFMSADFEALRDLKKPDILAAASPPDPKIVKMFYDSFSKSLGYDVPATLKAEFFKLAKPEILPFKSRATMLDQASTDLFFVCQGTALQCGSEEVYEDFCQWENNKGDEQRMMGEARASPKYSNMAKVGRVLLSYLLKNRTVKMTVEFKKEFLAAKEFEEQCATLNGLKKIDEGESFGDFELITGKPFKRQCNIAMKAPTLVLRIANADVVKLFATALLPENMTMIQKAFSGMRLKPVLMKKLSRSFILKELPPRAILIQEGKPLEYLYIIKRGTCAMTRDADPFTVEIQPAPLNQPKEPTKGDSKKKDGEKSKAAPASKAEQANKGTEEVEYLQEKICLAQSDSQNFGLTESTMTGSMRRFNIMDLQDGCLFGEEALFTSQQKLNYSVHTVSQCTVFAMAIEDFRFRCSKEYLNTLRDNCLKNQIQRLLRIRQIHKSSAKFRQDNDQLQKFYATSIKTIYNLHPHASKKIAKFIEQEFVLEGVVRTTRNKASVDVGEISISMQADKLSYDEAKNNKIKPMSQGELLDEAIAIHKKRDQKTKCSSNLSCPFEIFKGSPPVSPTGVVLVEERKGRQQRLEMKSKHFAEGEKKQMKPSLSSVTYAKLANSSLGTLSSAFNSTSMELPTARNISVSAVKEIADSENYTEFGSEGVELGETDDFPREVMDALLSMDEKMEDRPIFIELPTDQADREKKTPLLEWRAQTVDLQYKVRGKTYMRKYNDPKADRSCIVYNRKAAEKQQQIELNTPRPVFLLPSSTPAVSNRYGQDYEGSVSPKNELPDIANKSKSPSVSALPNTMNGSRFLPESPVMRNSVPLKHSRARTWNQILQSSTEKSHVLHQSSLYRGQMVTDKLKKSLQLSAFDMQEQKRAADRFQYLKAQLLGGVSSSFNQGGSSPTMTLGESPRGNLQLPAILNSPSELHYHDNVEASFRSEMPSIHGNSSLFMQTNVTPELLNQLAAEHGERQRAIDELQHAMDVDIQLAEKTDRTSELKIHKNQDSMPVSIMKAVQNLKESCRKNVCSNMTTTLAAVNQDLEYDMAEEQPSPKLPKKTGRLIIVPPMLEGNLRPLDIDFSTTQSKIEPSSALNRNGLGSVQSSGGCSRQNVRSTLRSGGTKFSVHSPDGGRHFIQGGSNLNMGQTQLSFKANSSQGVTDGFDHEELLEGQYNDREDVPVQVLSPQRFTPIDARGYSGKKVVISKEAKEIEDFNVYIRDKKREQQTQNSNVVVQKNARTAHLNQAVRQGQIRARMSSVGDSSCQNYNFEQTEVQNKSTGDGFTIKQFKLNSKPDLSKTMRQGQRRQFSQPRERAEKSPPIVNKDIIEHTRKSPNYLASKNLKQVESTDKIINSDDTPPLLVDGSTALPTSAQHMGRTPSLEEGTANIAADYNNVQREGVTEEDQIDGGEEISERRIIYTRVEKQQELAKEQQRKQENSKSGEYQPTKKKQKKHTTTLDEDAAIEAEFNEHVISLQSQMEQNSNRKSKNNIVPYRLHRFKIDDDKDELNTSGAMQRGSTLGRNSPSEEQSIEQQQQSIFRKNKAKDSTNSSIKHLQKESVIPKLHEITKQITQKRKEKDLLDSQREHESARSPTSNELNNTKRDRTGTGGRSYAKIVSHLNQTEDENKREIMRDIRKHIIKKLKRRTNRRDRAAYYSQPPYVGESPEKVPGKKRVAIHVFKRGAANDSDVESEQSNNFSGLNQLPLGPMPGSVQGRHSNYPAQNNLVSSTSELRQVKPQDYSSAVQPNQYSFQGKVLNTEDSKGQFRKHSSLKMTASEMAKMGISAIAAIPTLSLFGAGGVTSLSKNDKGKGQVLPSNQGKEISTNELKQQQKSRKILASQGQN